MLGTTCVYMYVLVVCIGGHALTRVHACGEHTEHGPYPTASQSPEGEYPSENICELKSCCCTCLPCKEREGGRGRGEGMTPHTPNHLHKDKRLCCNLYMYLTRSVYQ